MGMYDTLKKMKSAEGWRYEHEFTTEIVVRQKNGVWIYREDNGGANGAWESKATDTYELNAQEVVNRLREWGVSEAEMSEVEDLKDLTY